MKKRILAVLLTAALILNVFPGGMFGQTEAEASVWEPEEECLQAGEIRLYDVTTGEKRSIPALLHMENDEDDGVLYITPQNAGTLAEMSVSETAGGWQFSDADRIYQVKLNRWSGLVTYCNWKCQDSVELIEYEDETYVNLEDILSVLGCQFAQEADAEGEEVSEDSFGTARMVYYSRQKNLLNFLAENKNTIVSLGVSQSELYFGSDGVWTTSTKSALSEVFSDFDPKIFVPFVNDNLYDQDDYESALQQLSLSNESFYDEQVITEIGSYFDLDDTGDLADCVSGINDFNGSVSTVAEGVSKLTELQETHPAAKMSTAYDVIGLSSGELKVFNTMFSVGMNIYKDVKIVVQAAEMAERSKEWSDEFKRELTFLANIDWSDYTGGNLKDLKQVILNLKQEYNAPTAEAILEAEYKAADQLLDIGTDMVPYLGPVLALIKGGVAVAKLNPQFKSAMEAYKEMAVVDKLLDIQTIAQNEMLQRYKEVEEYYRSGKAVQQELTELRTVTMLTLKCAVVSCSLTYSLYEALEPEDADWSEEAASLKSRAAEAMALISKLENTDQWDSQMYTISGFVSPDEEETSEGTDGTVKTAFLFRRMAKAGARILNKEESSESFTNDIHSYSTEFGYVRQPITKEVWTPGGSTNNGTNFVYSGGYTYYWENTAASYSVDDMYGEFYPLNSGDSQLVRIDAAGNKTTLLTASGYGNLGIRGDLIYYTDYDGVHSAAMDGTPVKDFGSGKILAGDDESGFLVCRDTSGASYSICMETGETFSLTGDYSSALAITNGKYYVSQSGSSDEIHLLECSLDGTESRELCSWTGSDLNYFSSVNGWMSIPCAQAAGSYIYYVVGSYAGTGMIWSGGNIIREDLKTGETEILVGDQTAGDVFRAACSDESQTEAQTLYYQDYTKGIYDMAMDLSSGSTWECGINTEKADAIFGSGLNLNKYIGTDDVPYSLVTEGEFESYGVSEMDSYGEKLLQIRDCQVEGGFVYYTVWYSTHNAALDLGWRYDYTRQATTVYRKNLSTGEVSVIHSF